MNTQHDNSMTAAASSHRGRRGNARLTAIIVTAAAVGLLGLVGLFSLRRQKEELDVQAAVSEALDALDEENIVKARELAGNLRKNHALNYEELGGPVFVLGAAMAMDAGSQQSQLERRRQFLVASRYLEEAKQRGFPSGRRKQGLVLLARASFLAEDYHQAIPRLEEAAMRAPERTAEFSRMLSLSHQRKTPPDWQKALERINEHLAEPLLTDAHRREAELMRGTILFHLGRYEDCLQELAAVQDNDLIGRAIVLRARVQIINAEQEAAKAQPNPQTVRDFYESAAASLQDPRVQLKRSSDSARLAQYLLGACFVKLDEIEKALKQFAHVRRQYYGFPESVAAFFEEAELLRDLHQDDEAIAAYKAVLKHVSEQSLDGNRQLTTDSLRKRMSKAFNDYFDRKMFDKALTLASFMPAVLTQAESTKLAATTYQAWADHLNELAAEQPIQTAADTRRTAEEKLREAGSAYAQLAELRLATANYSSDLFSSADAYLNGSDFRNAVKMIDLFFASRPKAKLPEALVIKGKALLSLNRLEEAIVPLQQCIDRHRESPESYHARLVLSRAYNEQQEIDKAKQTLRDNLESDLTPESLVWRESLFDLGRVLYLEASQDLARARAAGLTSPVVPQHSRFRIRPETVESLEKSYLTFGEAVSWLDQAIERWPEDQRSILARYMIARSHEHRAKLPRFRLQSEQIESTREKLRLEMANELDTAHSQFESLVIDLDNRQDTIELSDIERKILRNCYFAQADALFDRERYREAIQAYSSASNRYQHKPEALEALVQIAACYRRLSNHEKARGTLEQAKVVLNRIGDKADYAATTTRNSFAAWKDFLDWLSKI